MTRGPPSRPARHALAARPGLRRGRRLRGPGQRRGQPHRGSAVRVPPGLGRGERQPDGGARAVPVGEAGPGHRREPARAAGHPTAARGPDRVLGAGRVRCRGHRPGGGDRRGDRAPPAVRPAAAARRGGGGRRVDGGPRGAEPSRAAALRDGGHRAARGDHRRIRRGTRGQPGVGTGHAGRAGAPVRRDRDRAARGEHARCHRHAARDLPALRPRPGPPRPHRGLRPGPPAARDPLGRRTLPRDCRVGERRDAPARGRGPGRAVGNRARSTARTLRSRRASGR